MLKSPRYVKRPFCHNYSLALPANLAGHGRQGDSESLSRVCACRSFTGDTVDRKGEGSRREEGQEARRGAGAGIGNTHGAP